MGIRASNSSEFRENGKIRVDMAIFHIVTVATPEQIMETRRIQKSTAMLKNPSSFGPEFIDPVHFTQGFVGWLQDEGDDG